MLELFTDAALVEEVRAGDRDAGLVLWRRHSTDCRAAVASVVDDPRTTERVLRETFDRVLREIAAGTDPLAPFHLYLRTTALLDACLDGRLESSAPPVVRAFAGLPCLDQTVLWASTVEHATLTEIARTASVTADQAAARLRAAEARLRTRWVDEVLRSPQASPTCAWVTDRVAMLRAGYLGPAAGERYERHLSGCPACRAYVDDDARLPLTLVAALLRRPRPPGAHPSPGRAPGPSRASRPSSATQERSASR